MHVRENGHYDVGLRLFELGQALQERMPVREGLIPHVDAIAETTGETAFAMHYSQGQIAYLYDCVSTQDIRLGERCGMRAAPWNHPAGLAILAYRDEAEVLASLSSIRRESRKGLPTVGRISVANWRKCAARDLPSSATPKNSWLACLFTTRLRTAWTPP